jgi:hypothetical protein
LKHHPGGPNALGCSNFCILVGWFEFLKTNFVLKCHAFHIRGWDGHTYIHLYVQGRSQTVIGVTVVTESRGWGGGKGPHVGPRGPRRGPGKKAAEESAREGKKDKVCLRNRKEKNQS